MSGGVQTGRIGCGQHLLSQGDSGYFCMVVNPSDCAVAQPTASFPGAAWVACTHGQPDGINKDVGSSGGASLVVCLQMGPRLHHSLCPASHYALFVAFLSRLSAQPSVAVYLLLMASAPYVRGISAWCRCASMVEAGTLRLLNIANHRLVPWMLALTERPFGQHFITACGPDLAYLSCLPAQVPPRGWSSPRQEQRTAQRWQRVGHSSWRGAASPGSPRRTEP